MVLHLDNAPTHLSMLGTSAKRFPAMLDRFEKLNYRHPIAGNAGDVWRIVSCKLFFSARLFIKVNPFNFFSAKKKTESNLIRFGNDNRNLFD